MKNYLPIYVLLLALSLLPFFLDAQTSNSKKTISDDEAAFLKTTIEKIQESDQKYRNYLSAETTDDKLIAKIDSVYEAGGINAYFSFKKSLNLKLDGAVKDSLWQLQHAIDLQNHLTLKGIIDTYGFLTKALLEDNFHVQLLLLLHPPKDWDVEMYLQEYSALLREEVQAGRMPAITYATFYDNIKGKILGEPQLYGTNQQFDPATNKVLPPQIVNLEQSNKARKAIGLPELKEGEYRILESK
jgi:hypothetical protein